MTEWRTIDSAPRDGTLCKLRFRDVLGYWESPGPFFLQDDGEWYRVNPPTQLRGKPIAWNYADKETR